MTSFIFPFLSAGFFTRFIIAFGIIAFLYSKNKNDDTLRKGFIVLISLGAVVLVVGIVLFAVVFLTGGLGVMGNALARFSYYNYFN